MEELKEYCDYLSVNVIAERIADELMENGMITQQDYELVRIAEQNAKEEGFSVLLDIICGKQDCLEISYTVWKLLKMCFPRATTNCPPINDGLRFQARTGQFNNILLRLADYDCRPSIDIRIYKVAGFF